MGVKAALPPQELLMRADLDDFAFPHADDPCAGTNRRETMR